MSKPFDRYDAYVKKLEKEGRKFPVSPNTGEVNWTQVADESKTRRQWFYENRNKTFGKDKKTLDAIVKADIKRIGTDMTAPKDPDEELSKIADNRSREASQLRHMLEQKSKENEQLRSDLQKLKEENRVLKSKLSEAEGSKEEMLDSGRCFSL